MSNDTKLKPAPAPLLVALAAFYNAGVDWDVLPADERTEPRDVVQMRAAIEAFLSAACETLKPTTSTTTTTHASGPRVEG